MFEGRVSDAYNKRAGYFGWMGYGGSIFQWHPKLRIGFAYTPTLLEFHDMYNQRGGRLQVKILSEEITLLLIRRRWCGVLRNNKRPTYNFCYFFSTYGFSVID